MTNNQPNAWQVLIKNLNSIVGKEVKRQNILSLYFSWHHTLKPTDSTIDTYRRILTVLGYLDETNKKGIYKVAKTIPDDLTSSEAKKLSCKNISNL